MPKKKELFLVTQSPKAKYRASMETLVMVVEAPTKKDAIARAKDIGRGPEDWFGPSPYYSEAKAEKLKLERLYSY